MQSDRPGQFSQLLKFDRRSLPAMTHSSSKFVSRPALVLCGDSLLEQSTRPGGLASLLADQYSRKADVTVRGYSGYNTKHYIDLIKAHQANGSWNFQGLLVVWLGANDAAKPAPSQPEQHIPLDEYFRNLSSIIDLISDGSNSVILMTPPPVDDVAYHIHCKSLLKPTLRFLDVTRQYADAVLQVGKLKNVPVVNVFDGLLLHENWRDFLSDGLHLTAQGYRHVFELLMNTIQTKLHSWTSERLLLDAPIWQQAHDWDTAEPNYTN